MPSPAEVSDAHRRDARALLDALPMTGRIALTTHVNADGDGAGSAAAMWYFLKARGAQPVIVMPTPFPERYRFLLADAPEAEKSQRAVKEIDRADAVVVLDISDVGRLGQLGEHVAKHHGRVACIDHHTGSGQLPDGPRLVDPSACATGELVHDLLQTAGWEITPAAARAMYVAILTDTGGFRFSNTSPRALQVAAHLLELGVHPEEIYQRVYASAPEGRIRLMTEVLDTLVVELPPGLAWVTVPPGALERHAVDSEELEGVVEYPRSIQGVRLALLFREIAGGRIKVSFRSKDSIDVAELASRFGGGGHTKAAGASLAGAMADVQAEVLAAARATLG